MISSAVLIDHKPSSHFFCTKQADLIKTIFTSQPSLLEDIFMIELEWPKSRMAMQTKPEIPNRYVSNKSSEVNQMTRSMNLQILWLS